MASRSPTRSCGTPSACRSREFFNRYFYRFKPPRPLEEIEADIGAIGTEIVEMLREVARIPYGSES